MLKWIDLPTMIGLLIGHFIFTVSFLLIDLLLDHILLNFSIECAQQWINYWTIGV